MCVPGLNTNNLLWVFSNPSVQKLYEGFDLSPNDLEEVKPVQCLIGILRAAVAAKSGFYQCLLNMALAFIRRPSKNSKLVLDDFKQSSVHDANQSPVFKALPAVDKTALTAYSMVVVWTYGSVDVDDMLNDLELWKTVENLFSSNARTDSHVQAQIRVIKKSSMLLASILAQIKSQNISEPSLLKDLVSRCVKDHLLNSSWESDENNYQIALKAAVSNHCTDICLNEDEQKIHQQIQVGKATSGNGGIPRLLLEALNLLHSNDVLGFCPLSRKSLAVVGKSFLASVVGAWLHDNDSLDSNMSTDEVFQSGVISSLVFYIQSQVSICTPACDSIF